MSTVKGWPRAFKLFCRSKLIFEWKRAIKRFWSFRLAILSAVLSAAEVGVQIWQPDGIPSGMFAGIAGLVSLAAGVARIIAQPKAYES